jgi:hypothetical protein
VFRSFLDGWMKSYLSKHCYQTGSRVLGWDKSCFPQTNSLHLKVFLQKIECSWIMKNEKMGTFLWRHLLYRKPIAFIFLKLPLRRYYSSLGERIECAILRTRDSISICLSFSSLLQAIKGIADSTSWELTIDSPSPYRTLVIKQKNQYNKIFTSRSIENHEQFTKF